ncbi:hypothetical protein, partial [Methylobacterium radiotolerans]|uniref:hypothetical protein n=1 Tax=Methylobacterium radiotolerans TaxID=31998 RepID=UPI001AEC88BA
CAECLECCTLRFRAQLPPPLAVVPAVAEGPGSPVRTDGGPPRKGLAEWASGRLWVRATHSP